MPEIDIYISGNKLCQMNLLEEELSFNVEAIRKDFPILSTKVFGKPLVYLDNAATTQKPDAVLNVQNIYY